MTNVHTAGLFFYDFGCVDTRKPFYLKIKHEDEIHIYKVKMGECAVNYKSNDTHFWCDNRIYDVICTPDIDIDMRFHVVE